MLRIMEQPLMSDDKGAVALIVPAGVEVSVVFREERRRQRHADSMARLEDARREPQVDVVPLDTARRQQNLSVESMPKPCACHTVLHTLGVPVREYVEQHHVPIRVL